MLTMRYFFTWAILVFLVVVGCDREIPDPAKKSIPVATGTKKGQATAKRSDVVKIVFVGQKQSCDCTRKRIDKSWKTLHNALKGNGNIPVERIQLDVHEAETDRLDNLRSLMVIPGIYFFDANENLLELLQGEVTAGQISKIL